MHPRNKPVLIFASFLACLIIGGSVWYTQFRTPDTDLGDDASKTEQVKLDEIRGIQPDDHVRGNPEAKLVFVVYSDFGCPYCKEFHKTMQQLIDKYGRQGDVAWVFRQLPLVQLHPQANVYALASECVAEHGGNQAFWKFADLLFEEKQPDSEVSAPRIVALASESGVDADTFTTCMESDKLQERITRDFNEARVADVIGSPFTVIMTKDQRASLKGARPFAALAAATETLLRTIGVTTLAEPGAGDSASNRFNQELYKTPPVTPAAATTTTSTSTLP